MFFFVVVGGGGFFFAFEIVQFSNQRGSKFNLINMKQRKVNFSSLDVL